MLENRRTRVIPSGPLDVSTSAQFTEEMHGLLEHGGAIHVDLAKVEFMDSTGIAALMKLSQAARKSLQQLTFSPGTGQVQSVLDMVRAEQFLIFAAEPAEERAR